MEKIKEIDYLRGLSTIFVILIHLTSSYLTYSKDSLTYNFFGTFNCSLTFVVPAFLFISVFLMTYQVKNKETINWLKFISKRIFKVLLALILWTVIYIIYNGTLENITFKNIMEYLMLGNASYHLYFIPLIIQLYMIFPFIWIISKKLSTIKINTLLSFILCIISAILIHSSFTLIFRLNILKTFQHFATVIFSYTLPIFIGTWIGFNYNNIKKYYNKFFIIFLIMLSIICNYYYVKFEFINYTYKTTLLFSPIYWTIIILTLVYLLRYIKNSTFLNKISKNSFIIYLSHPLIIDIINNKFKLIKLSITNSQFINYGINIILQLIIVLGTSYFISILFQKIKRVVQK